MANKGKRKYTPQQLSIIRKNYAARDQPAGKTREAAKSEKESFPHFRYKRNQGSHPYLIVGEYSPREYNHRQTTHEKSGNHKFETLKKNPNPKDSRPMYIERRVKHSPKKSFRKEILPWVYPDKRKKGE